jgi:hypothetical protein
MDGTYAITIRRGDAAEEIGELTLSEGKLQGQERGGLRFEGRYDQVGPDSLHVQAVIHLDRGTVMADGKALEAPLAHHLDVDVRPVEPGVFEYDVDIPGLGATHCRFERRSAQPAD